MHRLFSATLASAMAAAFLFAGGAAIAKTGGKTSSMTSEHGTHMKHSCPAGQHWVKGYMRDGKKVHGYCRK